MGVERFNRTIQEAIFRDEDFPVNPVEDKQEANRTIESYIRTSTTMNAPT